VSRRTTLTDRQQAFVAAYLANGRNGRAAYRAAFGTKGAATTVAKEAAKLLAHPLIAPLIAAAEAKADTALAAAADRYAISRASISQELAALAYSTVETLGAWVASGAQVRLGDKRGALMDLARLHGLVVEPPRTVRVIRGIEDLTDDELAVLAEGE
jgi:terminase small subunit-like protein